MSSVNKVMLIGNLGRDPEARSFANGDEVVSFSIATGESWKDKATGERKERTEWHNVAVMNQGLCRIAKNYLRKGSKVYVEGQLRTRKWQDQSGNDRWLTEIVLGAFNAALTLLDKREGDPGRHDYSGHRDTPGGSGGGGSGGGGSGGGGSGGGSGGHADDLDDDVPF